MPSHPHRTVERRSRTFRVASHLSFPASTPHLWWILDQLSTLDNHPDRFCGSAQSRIWDRTRFEVGSGGIPLSP